MPTAGAARARTACSAWGCGPWTSSSAQTSWTARTARTGATPSAWATARARSLLSLGRVWGPSFRGNGGTTMGPKSGRPDKNLCAGIGLARFPRVLLCLCARRMVGWCVCRARRRQRAACPPWGLAGALAGMWRGAVTPQGAESSQQEPPVAAQTVGAGVTRSRG